MAKIKAIETVYNGYKFRSRLEARWAVFFDAAGIKYEYEPQGFEMDDGTRYLPDFYLPELDVYAEVKGDRPGVKKDVERYAKMITWGGPIKALVILSDIPGPCVDGGLPHFPVLYYSVHNWHHERGTSVGWFFFADCYAHISSACYPAPFWLDECGNVINEPVSILSRTDVELRGNNRDLDSREEIEAWYSGFDYAIKWRVDFQLAQNKKTFEAFEKARQARFEHGEQPVI